MSNNSPSQLGFLLVKKVTVVHRDPCGQTARDPILISQKTHLAFVHAHLQHQPGFVVVDFGTGFGAEQMGPGRVEAAEREKIWGVF